MLFHDHSLQSYHYEKKDMGYAERNKRHAQESMMKKMRDRKERKIAHMQEKEKRNKGEMVHEKEFIHPSTKNIHTHAHLDQDL
jgi:hypothetical protein